MRIISPSEGSIVSAFGLIMSDPLVLIPMILQLEIDQRVLTQEVNSDDNYNPF
jgi:hypothetical protein